MSSTSPMVEHSPIRHRSIVLLENSATAAPTTTTPTRHLSPPAAAAQVSASAVVLESYHHHHSTNGGCGGSGDTSTTTEATPATAALDHLTTATTAAAAEASTLTPTVSPSSSTTMTYPVATFVTVRDWISASIFETSSPSDRVGPTNTTTTTNAMTTATSPNRRGSSHSSGGDGGSGSGGFLLHSEQNNNNNNNNTDMLLQEEFIVVDGDLIAVPAHFEYPPEPVEDVSPPFVSHHPHYQQQQQQKQQDHHFYNHSTTPPPPSSSSSEYADYTASFASAAAVAANAAVNAATACQQAGKPLRGKGLRNKLNKLFFQRQGGRATRQSSKDASSVTTPEATGGGGSGESVGGGAANTHWVTHLENVVVSSALEPTLTHVATTSITAAPESTVMLLATTGVASSTNNAVINVSQPPSKPDFRPERTMGRKDGKQRAKKEKKPRGVGWVQRRFKAAPVDFGDTHAAVPFHHRKPHPRSSHGSMSTLGCALSDDPPSHEDLQLSLDDATAARTGLAAIPLVRRNSLIDDTTAFSSGLEPPAIYDDRRRFVAAANVNDMDGFYTATTGYDDFVSPLDHRHQPPIPMRIAHEASPDGTGIRTTSVTASYVGTADCLLADGFVLPDASVPAESFIEEDIFDFGAPSKKDDSELYLPMSLVAENADLKVDKAETPDVEAMLRRAVIETSTDLEAPMDSDSVPTCLPIPDDFCYALSPGGGTAVVGKTPGKSDRSSIPLSHALPHHLEVHNDTLKVVMVSASCVDKSMVARRLRNCSKRPRKRTTLAVDVHEWRPNLPSESASADMDELYTSQSSPVKCMIWDVQGASPHIGSTAESRSNFGTHAGTQSLFFSPQSLYLLCWDLACNNPKTNRVAVTRELDEDDSDFDEDEDDEDEYEDEFIREEANRQADRALHADISHRVLSWFDCIARSGPKSAILPVALITEGMSEFEVKRRCDMMRILLEDHVHKSDHGGLAPKLLTGTENSILCVNSYGESDGIQQLQDMVAAIANDKSNSVFEHIGTPVPPGTVLVREAIERFKEEHKLILLDHLMGELGTSLGVHEIVGALHFLSNIGEIMYFGTDDDEVLSRYVILSRKWLISALSCILRNDLKRELIETRRFMNMQCIYSDQKYDENEITRALVSGKSSSCPLLSDEDAKMLWQSMSFMREASDRYSNLVERSTTVPTMFYFLERLLVHSGVFLPLRASQENASMNQSEVFFVPSLLAQADPTNMWTYMTSESWMTTLCHSWLFRDGSPPNLMEHLTVGILRDLYQFSRTFQTTTAREPIHRVHSVPIGRNSFGEFVNEHKTEAIGTVRIHHVMCFKSSILVKIGTVFADDKSGLLRESVVEVFVALVDQTSSHAVASDVMRPCMQRVVVSGKGQAGRHGHKLWKGGYKRLLDTVRGSLENMPNVDSQAICPECLATGSPRIASTWGWDVVLAASESGNPHVICLRGHRVNSNLICGSCPERKTAPFMDPQAVQRNSKALNIKEALPSVVLVGVWDPASKTVISVGSGFIVDKKSGLIVTAGHVLFNLEGGSHNFGKPYFGRQGARAVIGVIPNKDGKNAVFRYFAEIVAHDIRNVDACVLQIRSRLEKDVDDKEGVGALNQAEKPIGTDKMLTEELRSLKLTKHFDLAESVRLLGYSQEGEGIYEQGKHISPSIEFVEGLIRRHFKATMYDDSVESDCSSTASSHSQQRQQHQSFSPREEIVMHCLVNSGHSGGPCVNSDGKVVGMLSRSDPVERDRCYLVPTSEIRPLILKAKSLCAPRPPRITSMQTV